MLQQTHLAGKGFIDFIYINVLQRQTYGQDLKGDYFCLVTVSKPPTANSSSPALVTESGDPGSPWGICTCTRVCVRRCWKTSPLLAACR